VRTQQLQDFLNQVEFRIRAARELLDKIDRQQSLNAGTRVTEQGDEFTRREAFFSQPQTGQTDVQQGTDVQARISELSHKFSTFSQLEAKLNKLEADFSQFGYQDFRHDQFDEFKKKVGDINRAITEFNREANQQLSGEGTPRFRTERRDASGTSLRRVVEMGDNIDHFIDDLGTGMLRFYKELLTDFSATG